jgi:regulator of sirC expression with transglutaminase-like and TPR domain
MNSSAPLPVLTRQLSENERTALLNLLGDDDPAVYPIIRARILSIGPPAGSWLRPHVLSNDPVLRRHARDIVRHLDRQETDTNFLAFCLGHGEEFDLEEGAWLLAQTEYPDINVEAYEALLDHFTSELRARIDPEDAPREILADMNCYIFDDLGFGGNQENYYDVDNSYFNRVIDRRTGNPINLCLLYLCLAKRLQLPISGIGLPGHFICRYQTSDDEIYIDVFNRGRLLSKADCVQYLLRGNFSLREDFLAPATARRILMRMCSNLHQIYLQLKQADKTTRLQRYLVALAR